ncbi:MAG: hypothetical protein BGO12_12890 [Verrucomicrobia bacterium 61-8]|nr:hypothetical protein [Verrucomicrobiota bacterium]OJV17142.1 MAG: hypothetical protein BGO12_12890 [Verrucomicrobia bacterium 61-8]
MLVAAIRRFGLLGLIAARKGSDLLCKTQHRLRKKDEHGAKAQCEKSIFAGYCHGLSSISQGSKPVNIALLGVAVRTPAFDNDTGEGITLPRALNECLNTLCRVGISAVDQDSCWFPDNLLSAGSSRQPEH